ncbi:MAG: hypothetical protein AAFS10_23030 [Myxococcota bacterium]
MWRLWTAIGCLVVVVGGYGCGPRLAPRSAEIARPGEWVGTMNVAASSAGSGRTEMTREDSGELLERRGWVTSGVPLPPIGYTIPWWLQGDVRVGLLSPCEVGPLLSAPQLGGEVRCGLMSQRDGDPVALAFSVAGARSILLKDRGLWWRSGFDLSTRSKARLLMTRLHLSYGPELHTMKLHDLPSDLVEQKQETGLNVVFGRLGNQGTWARVERDELRLHLALGVGWWLDDEGTWMSVGLTPSVALWTGDNEVLDCVGCTDSLRVDAFVEEFSMELVLTLGVSPEGTFVYGARQRKGLLTAGWILTTAGVPMLIGPIASVSSAHDIPLRDNALLLLPVAGPLLWRSRADDAVGGSTSDRAWVDGIASALVVTQVTGITLLMATWFLFDDRPYDGLAAGSDPVAVQPVMLGDTPGLSAQGRF